MKPQPPVGDIYAPLADLLANLIAKYADVLELDDDREETVPDAGNGKPRPSESIQEASRRLPFFFCCAF